MALIETWYNQDLQSPVVVHHLHGNVFSQDNQGNLIGVNVFDGDAPATLSGTVTGYIIRADGATVPVTGNLSGNSCTVILSEECYAVEGIISIVIKLAGNGSRTTLCAVVANVYASVTGTAIDSGTIIPDVQALIETINQAFASLPPDYNSLVKDVQEINKIINNTTTYHEITSLSGWAVTVLVPSMSLVKDDYIILDVDFETAPQTNTYIYLRDGDTNITSYNCKNLTTKHITYKATGAINAFRIVENADTYTGKVYAKITKATAQTLVDKNEITSDEVAKEKYGFFTLQRLSPFVRGGNDYPNFNYNSFQVSSRDVMVAPFPLFMLIGSGYKALANTIGDTVTSSGWQEHSIYIPAGNSFVLKIEKVSHGSDEVADIEEYLDAVKVYDDGMCWHNIIDYADSFNHSAYIAYATGAITSASGYFELYRFKNPQFRFVKLHTSIYARDIAEIAFYSTDEVTTEGYIQSASQYAGSWKDDHYVYAEVPSNAKLMCICSRNQLNSGDPFTVEVFVDNADQYKTVELDHRTYPLNAFTGYKYIYHFNASNPTAEIPSESLFDIDMAHRLGFKAFELNVHKTATAGVFVCMRGVSGKLGTQLVARDGTTDISDYKFEDCTEQQFREDFVYNTSETQYRTRVTFLDEAIALCKKYGMLPLVSWADYGAIEYFEKYTSGRYLLNIYDSYYIRRANCKGAYCLYQSLTAQELSEVLDKSGAPLFYSITNAESSLTDAQLKQLAEICHSKQSFIGSAGVYQTALKNMQLFDLGFDFMSSGWEVEDFTNGNALSLHNLSEFATTGSISGGALSLSNGQSIGATYTGTPYISKGALRIRYNGTLVFTMGSYAYNVSIESDGSKEVVLTTAFFKQSPVFSAIADGAVTVYSCVYDASIC
jgi:hypothetical protein